MEGESDFGAGLVVCLAKFSEHLTNHREFEKLYSEIGKDKALARHDSIVMCMNAASDHFYDLDRDKAPAPLIELADLTLKIGHGFKSERYDDETWDKIIELWKESCLALDRMLNTNPIWGTW